MIYICTHFQKSECNEYQLTVLLETSAYTVVWALMCQNARALLSHSGLCDGRGDLTDSVLITKLYISVRVIF